MALKAGQPAPDFTLKSHLGNQVRLSSFRGSCNVVLAFFPLAWTPI
jgi:peroxiredoxin